MEKKDLEKENLFVLKVLDAMNTYLHNADRNSHNPLSMIYCDSCRAIGSAGGDYSVYAGSDCMGASYKTVRAPEQCMECHTGNFAKISKYDMSKLKGVYGGRTTEIILEGIKRGLENLRYPELYNEELPKIARKWKRVSKKERIRQVNQLLSTQKKLSVLKGEVKSLEETLV